jgi:hypothetical protein
VTPGCEGEFVNTAPLNGSIILGHNRSFYAPDAKDWFSCLPRLPCVSGAAREHYDGRPYDGQAASNNIKISKIIPRICGNVQVFGQKSDKSKLHIQKKII